MTLGVPYSRIYSDMLAGKFPVERHGQRWYVRRTTLEELRAKQAPVTEPRAQVA